MDPAYNGLIKPKFPNPLAEEVRGDKREIIYQGASLQPLPLDLTVAQSLKEFQLQGNVLYVDSEATGIVGLRLDTTWQRSYPLRANSKLKGYPYKSVILEWTAQPGLTAVLWYGYGVDLVPPNQNISAIGTLNTIVNPVPLDPEYAKYFLFGDDEVDDGEAFIALTRPIGGPGTFAQSQLKNPLASGKTVYLDRCTCQSIGGASFARFSLNDTDLLTLTGAPQSKNGIGAAVAPVAQVRQDSNAGIFGTQVSLRGVEANNSVVFEFKPPFKMTVGKGVSVSSEVVNLEFDTCWEWRERV